jgi:hypothetical protein
MHGAAGGRATAAERAAQLLEWCARFVILTTLQILQITLTGAVQPRQDFGCRLHRRMSINVSTAVLYCLLRDIEGTIYGNNASSPPLHSQQSTTLPLMVLLEQ